MPELEEKIAQLEAIEKDIQQKQAELEKAKAEIQDYEKRKEALAQELARVQEEITRLKEERREEKEKEESFLEKLRKENFEAAVTRFFNEFGYKPEDQSKFLEAFKKYDSGAVNPDLIYEDLLRAHVALNPKKYISLEKELEKLRESSTSFNAEMSTTGFISGEKTSPGVELTEDDIRAAKWANIPLERYKELKAKGLID